MERVFLQTPLRDTCKQDKIWEKIVVGEKRDLSFHRTIRAEEVSKILKKMKSRKTVRLNDIPING